MSDSAASSAAPPPPAEPTKPASGGDGSSNDASSSSPSSSAVTIGKDNLVTIKIPGTSDTAVVCYDEAFDTDTTCYGLCSIRAAGLKTGDNKCFKSGPGGVVKDQSVKALQKLKCSSGATDLSRDCRWEVAKDGAVDCGGKFAQVQCSSKGKNDIASAVTIIKDKKLVDDYKGKRGLLGIVLRYADGTTYENGAVCDSGFDQKDCEVACREIGQQRSGKSWPCGFYASTRPKPGNWGFMFEGFQCKGDEESLDKCPISKPFGQSNCTNEQYIFIECDAAYTTRVSQAAIVTLLFVYLFKYFY